MYRYDEFDAAFVRERTAQFADQVNRRLSGEMNEDQFRPLRLMNGLYLQLHAYMLRVAVPYGTLDSRQMRMLAHVARTYDRGYGHFTTRQNIQFNWIRLEDACDVGTEGDPIARAEEGARRVNGPYVIDATATAAGPRPAHIKDRIRALGPTVRADLTLKPADPAAGEWVI